MAISQQVGTDVATCRIHRQARRTGTIREIDQ
jgi:hypothetical protein